MTISNASAEHVAALASEFAVEQRARRDIWVAQRGPKAVFEFYIQASEVEASQHIATLLEHYAILKGYINQDQKLRVARPVTRERMSDDER